MKRVTNYSNKSKGVGIVAQIIDTSAPGQTHFFQREASIASCLGSLDRNNLSLAVLARTEPISYLAQNYKVSRKFFYQQATKASYALDEVFMPSADEVEVLFYLLAAEDQPDETTWGVHLLELAEKGLQPDYTIVDAGRDLRAGQLAVWDDVPCYGYVFHAERDLGKLAFFLEN